MADANLHVSSEFFKTLSLESRQLNHTLRLLGTFAYRASVRGQELGDRRMVIISSPTGTLCLNSKASRGGHCKTDEKRGDCRLALVDCGG